MEQRIDVDHIWRSLGTWGRYQIGQLAVMWMGMIPCSIHLMAVVFIGYRPGYQCNDVTYSDFGFDVNSTNADDVVISYEQCRINYYLNTTMNGSIEEKHTDCINGYKYDDHKDISFVSEWDLVCKGADRAELSQALVMLGQGVGGFIFTGISDKFGRKPVHVVSHICLFIITLTTAFVPTYMAFAPLRFFTGAAIEGLLLTCATQYVETLPVEWRFCAEVVALVTWTTGIVLVTPFGYLMRNISWRYIQIGLALISVYSLVEYWLFDESLRWLMANGKLKEAERVLRKAAKRNKLDYDKVIQIAKAKTVEEEEAMKSMNKDQEIPVNPVDKGETEKLVETVPSTANGTETVVVDSYHPVDKFAVKKYSMLTILKTKRILINSLIIWFCWITNSLTYYGLSLISASLTGDRFLNYFLFGIIEYVSSFLEFMLLNRIGRKLTLMLLYSITGVSLLVATLLITLANNNQQLLTLSTVFAVVGKFGITGTFSCVFLYTSELYPTNLRNAGYGYASVAARIGGVIAPFSSTLVQHVKWGPGAIFTIMCGISTFLITFLPETMGHELPTTIEELKTWYKDHSGFMLVKYKKNNKDKNSDSTHTKI